MKTKRVTKDTGKRALQSRPVFIEHGTLDVNAEFFLTLSHFFALKVMGDPTVCLRKEGISQHQLDFDSFIHVSQTIHLIISHWIGRMLRYEPVQVPIPMPLYALFQPYIHPRVMTVNGVHKCNVSLVGASAALVLNDEDMQRGNDLFGREGFFVGKKGWELYEESDYLDKNKRPMPIFYTVQRNTKRPSSGKKAAVQFLKRRVDPRKAGLVRLGASVIGQLTSDLGVNEQMCVKSHVRLLHHINFKDNTIKSLDRASVPRVNVNEKVAAVACGEMVYQGTHEGLLGICGVATHIPPPFTFHSTTLTCCKAIAKLPVGHIPGELNQPPAPVVFRDLFLVAKLLKNPAAFLTLQMDPGQLFKIVASFGRAMLGQSLVPQILSEATNHCRTTTFPFDEGAGSETGYILSLGLLPDKYYDTKNFNSFDYDKKLSDDWVIECFTKASYVQKFCGTLGNTMTSSPLVSSDATGGLLSVRTVQYRLSNQLSGQSLTIPPNTDTSPCVDSSLTIEQYKNIEDVMVGTFNPKVPTLVLNVNKGGFVDESDDILVHPTDEALQNMTRSMITHIPNFDYAHARHIAASYNLPIACDETASYTVASEDLKNLHTACGYTVLCISTQREGDTIPTSTIQNPGGDTHSTVVGIMNQIAVYGGFGDFFNSIGDSLLSVGKGIAKSATGLLNEIPIVGPLASAAANQLIDNL